MTAIRLKNGNAIDPLNDIWSGMEISGDPTTSAGCAAGIGTIARRVDSVNGLGEQYLKIGAAATAWALFAAPAGGPVSQNSGTAVTVDCSLGSVQQITLNGVTPVITITNFHPGQHIQLELTQDATGSRIPSYSPALKGTAVTLTTTAAKRDIIFLYADALGFLVIRGSVLNL